LGKFSHSRWQLLELNLPMEAHHFDYITKLVKETHSFKDSLALCEETHTVNALVGRHNVLLISMDVDLINLV